MSASVSYSQCGEDIIMLFLAQHVLELDRIYYLDIGANEPDHFNNTQLFYENGYLGLSVDANPYFEKLHRAARPDAQYLTCGIGDAKGKATFYEINPHTLSTFSKQEADRYVSENGHSIVSEHKLKIKTVADIIVKECKEIPNVLSLDVEGMDFKVLKSIDFKAWRPAIVCVETITYSKHGEQRKLSEIIEFLEAKNYMVYADTYINTIFVDRDVWNAK